MPISIGSLDAGAVDAAPSVRVTEGIRDQVAAGHVTQAQVVINDAAKALVEAGRIDIDGTEYRVQGNSIWFVKNQVEEFISLYNRLEAVAGEWAPLA